MVWVWPGDPALADPGKMPDFHWNDGSDWIGEGGTYYGLKCDYRLVIDNLMDLTHETYVHAGSIGHEAITATPFEVTHTDRSARVTRWMVNTEPPPFWAKQLGRSVAVDRWQIIDFQASVVVGDVGAALTGSGGRRRRPFPGRQRLLLAAVTPQTDTTCHYFWNFVRGFRKDDAALTQAIHLAHVTSDGKGLYDQDVAVLEAQQKAIERQPRMPFYNLNIDAGALWARRKIDRMLGAEHGPHQDAAE